MSDTEGVFHFALTAWAQAAAHIMPCECCGSLGRVGVRNQLGKEFLQLCAVSGSELSAWAAFLDVAADNGVPAKSVDAADMPDADATTAAWVSALPRLAGDATLITADWSDLANILEVVLHKKLPVRWTLRGAEFCHSRVFAPHRHEITGGGRVFSVRGANAETMQLGLPMMHALAIGAHAEDCALHVVGPDNTRLLTLSAADGREEAGLWRIIMRNYFPEATGN